MNVTVKTIQPADLTVWDEYVSAHPQSTLYHLAGWKNVFEKTYVHKTHYLMATKRSRHEAGSWNAKPESPINLQNSKLSANSVELNAENIGGFWHAEGYELPW